MVENAVLYSKFYLRFAKNSVFDNITKFSSPEIIHKLQVGG